MEIEEYLGRFEPASPPPALRAKLLRAARPWRPFYLAAAAAALLALWIANERCEERLERALGPMAARAPDRPGPPALATLIRLRLEIGRRS